jgi:hypothetical protein
MTKNSYAEQIHTAQLMLSGLNNNAKQLANCGITTEFIDKLSTGLTDATALDNEQEKLKSDLKTKTAELTVKLTAIAQFVAEAKKIVKLDLPQERWKEFGIDNKR